MGRHAVVLALTAVVAASGTLAAAKEKDRRPSLSLKASPMMAFSPAKIFLTAELKGGANDFEEYYCTSIEWDWGDGTRSESTADCEPYQEGKSEIKRHFTTLHEFKTSGSYRIQVRLKKKNKPVAAANVTVQVRPGFRDPGL